MQLQETIFILKEESIIFYLFLGRNGYHPPNNSRMLWMIMERLTSDMRADVGALL